MNIPEVGISEFNVWAIKRMIGRERCTFPGAQLCLPQYPDKECRQCCQAELDKEKTEEKD